MPDKTDPSEVVIPVVEEHARIETRTVPIGKVRVSTKISEHLERVEADLAREDVRVVRVPINRPVDAMPAIREEDGVVIFPVVEETLIVEKRLILREEIRLVRNRHTEHVQQDVTVRSSEAVIEREGEGNA